MIKKWMVCTTVVALAVGGAVWWQQSGNGGDNNGGGGGERANRGERGEGRGEGRGNFDPAEMRQRMIEFFKEQLKTTDDEWKILEPKLERVVTVQRNSRAGGGMFGMGFGGRRGGGQGGGAGGGDQPQTEVAKATSALRATLQKDNAPTDEVKTNLTALRDARKKALAELEAARKDLSEVLTPRQEAVLVMAGLLE